MKNISLRTGDAEHLLTHALLNDVNKSVTTTAEYMEI